MSTIERIGKVHKAGRKGKQRWRVKYWLAGDPQFKTKYLGAAEGKAALSKREAEVLRDRFNSEAGAGTALSDRHVPSLQEHIAHYTDTLVTRYAPEVQEGIKRACRMFAEHNRWGRRKVHHITAAMADSYVAHLAGKGRADATIKGHVDNLRPLFKLAMIHYPDHVKKNPFGHLRIKPKPKKGTCKYVTYTDALKALEACPEHPKSSKIGWQVFIALQRFAGLRLGEAQNLEKVDVDLTPDPPLIKVYASKTARSTGVPSRVVPVLFPKLSDLLVRAISETSPAERYVVPSNVPRKRSDAHRTLKAILKRAGLVDQKGCSLWRPGFQVLRCCCERDFLQFGLSEYQYTRAIGHSPEVSRANYMAKFEDAIIEEMAQDEYRSAASKARQHIKQSIKSNRFGYTPGIRRQKHEQEV